MNLLLRVIIVSCLMRNIQVITMTLAPSTSLSSFEDSKTGSNVFDANKEGNDTTNKTRGHQTPEVAASKAVGLLSGPLQSRSRPIFRQLNTSSNAMRVLTSSSQLSVQGHQVDLTSHQASLTEVEAVIPDVSRMDFFTKSSSSSLYVSGNQQQQQPSVVALPPTIDYAKTVGGGIPDDDSSDVVEPVESQSSVDQLRPQSAAQLPVSDVIISDKLNVISRGYVGFDVLMTSSSKSDATTDWSESDDVAGSFVFLLVTCITVGIVLPSLTAVSCLWIFRRQCHRYHQQQQLIITRGPLLDDLSPIETTLPSDHVEKAII